MLNTVLMENKMKVREIIVLSDYKGLIDNLNFQRDNEGENKEEDKSHFENLVNEINKTLTKFESENLHNVPRMQNHHAHMLVQTAVTYGNSKWFYIKTTNKRYILPNK